MSREMERAGDMVQVAQCIEKPTPEHGDDAKPQTIASDLAGGKRTSAALAKNGGCLYDISGLFSDESVVEVNGADLCKDSTISLVE
jgi:hypothetical protein